MPAPEMRPMQVWTARESERRRGWPSRQVLGEILHRDIEEALKLARRRYGHNVTVDNMAFLRRQPNYKRPTRTP